MSRLTDTALTALAPIVWGSTYFVTTEFLPDGYPVTAAALRALPAGLLLLLIARQVPNGIWWLRSAILGALNFTVFWALLFVAAYRLPGGVAATVGAVQPLIVVFLAAFVLGNPVRPTAILSALIGFAGVALLVLTGGTAMDPIGLAAGVGGAASMAAGTVLTRRWQPPVPLLTFTSWQLTAGGLLLVPLAIILEPALPNLTARNLGGFIYLAVIGSALTYLLWFRGIARIETASVSILGFLSPVSAVVIGWIALGQSLTALQLTGAALVLLSIWLGQRPDLLRRLARSQGRSINHTKGCLS